MYTFVTGQEGGTVEIALLAGNMSFKREPLVVTFSDISLKKAPVANLQLVQRLTTRDTAYKIHLAASRFKNRRPLDKTMSEFRPLPLAERFRVPETQYRFLPDELPQPDPEKLRGWKADESVVRRLPYPFFTAFTIPSDVCGTETLEDTLLSSSSFFREYGLDFSGSFFAHSVTSIQQSSFFDSDSHGFASKPIVLDNKKESKLFSLLTMYYRGWLTIFIAGLMETYSPIRYWSLRQRFPAQRPTRQSLFSRRSRWDYGSKDLPHSCLSRLESRGSVLTCRTISVACGRCDGIGSLLANQLLRSGTYPIRPWKNSILDRVCCILTRKHSLPTQQCR